MKVLGLVGLSVVLAASLTSTVMAEAPKAPKGEKHDMFKAADANGDGKLSLDEFKTMVKSGDAGKKFEAADANKDGFVTPAELKAARMAEHAARKAAKDAAAPAAVPAVPAVPAIPAK